MGIRIRGLGRRQAVRSGTALAGLLCSILLVSCTDDPMSGTTSVPSESSQSTGDSAEAAATPEKHQSVSFADQNTECAHWGVDPEDQLAHLAPIYEPDVSGTPVKGVDLNEDFEADGVESQYHLFTRGVDFSKPVGLVVRLHGDGTNEFDDPGGESACMAQVAASHNMIYLEPLSPDRIDDVTWWEDIPTNLAWLDALLHQKILPENHVDPSKVWWIGYSGGAEMLSYGVLPYHLDWVSGGAILLGGGGAPDSFDSQLPDKQQSQLDLTWITGIDDDGTAEDAPFDALDAARAGSQFYTAEGFRNVTTVWVGGMTHYTIPDTEILQEKLSGKTSFEVRPLATE